MTYAVLWLYMLGAVNASREDSHIRANVLEIFIHTQRGHTILAVIGEVISIVVASWLTWWAWDFLSYSLRTGRESPTLYLPMIYADASLFIGMAAMTLFTLFHLVGHARKLARGEVRDA
jgi:TRAP-type C4-dicarboxylate transport system permease small subunit